MNREQLKRVQRQLRESHQKVFALQGQLIDALFEQLRAVRETQDEMVKLFQADEDLDDASEE